MTAGEHAPTRGWAHELLDERALDPALSGELPLQVQSRQASYRDVAARNTGGSGQHHEVQRQPVSSPSQQARIRLRLEIHRVSEAALEADGWHVVRNKRDCRRQAIPRPQRPPILPAFRGRCFNCLERSHCKKDCREPTRCWRCGGAKHRSFECRTHKTSNGPQQNFAKPKSCNSLSCQLVEAPRYKCNSSGMEPSGSYAASAQPDPDDVPRHPRN